MEHEEIVQEMFQLGLYYSNRSYICQRSWDLFIMQKEKNIENLKRWVEEPHSPEMLKALKDHLSDNESALKFAREKYQGYSSEFLLRPGVNVFELFMDRDTED